MRVGLDATPLLGQRTGIGRYVEHLVPALLASSAPPEVVLTAFTWRGAEPLAHVAGATVAARRAPARLLQQTWRRVGWPPVELLSGPVDVFHATNFVLPPTRRAAGVVTVHDLTFLHHADTATPAVLRYRDLVPQSVKRAQVVCAITHALADEVAEAYAVPPERMAVTTLGVGEEWFATSPPDAEWLRSRGLPERYLLFVGTQEPRKNLPVLLEAMARLRADDPSTPALVLVGGSGWGAALDRSRLPAGAVVMPGYLEGPDLRQVVAGAHALVHPARYEGFGLTPLEALACGTPAVVSDLPPLREVLGDCATFVPVGDVDALVAAIAATLAVGDGGPAARAARVAQARRHTWASCAEQTLTAYRRALDLAS